MKSKIRFEQRGVGHRSLYNTLHASSFLLSLFDIYSRFVYLVQLQSLFIFSNDLKASKRRVMDHYNRGRTRFELTMLFGDPFALATVSVAIVCLFLFYFISAFIILSETSKLTGIDRLGYLLRQQRFRRRVWRLSAVFMVGTRLSIRAQSRCRDCILPDTIGRSV